MVESGGIMQPHARHTGLRVNTKIQRTQKLLTTPQLFGKNGTTAITISFIRVSQQYAAQTDACMHACSKRLK